MTMTTAPATPAENVAELLAQLGDIPPRRVLIRPAPGNATEEHLLAVNNRHERVCELVDGTLVEKGMGFRESVLAGAILAALRAFVLPRNLGLVVGADGMMRLVKGLVRVPDAAFISWDRIPGRRMPSEPIPSLGPDIAVEVLSESNTAKEMERKRQEYFAAGGRLVWLVDPDDRLVAVYTSPENPIPLREPQVLDGGDVLPGFRLSLGELFAELDRHGPPNL